MCLYRSQGSFPEGLAHSLSAAARPLALALRSSLVCSTVLGQAQVPAAVGLPPSGLLLADRTGRVREVNDDARALLGGDRPGDLAQVVQSVVARRAAGHLGGATAMTSARRWLTFHATPLGDTLAVVVEQVRPHQLAEIIVRARGLTVREREVVELLARSLSNRHIARDLQVSDRAGPPQVGVRRVRRRQPQRAGRVVVVHALRAAARLSGAPPACPRACPWRTAATSGWSAPPQRGGPPRRSAVLAGRGRRRWSAPPQ